MVKITIGIAAAVLLAAGLVIVPKLVVEPSEQNPLRVSRSPKHNQLDSRRSTTTFGAVPKVVVAAADVMPAFYDDFSDGKWQDRTGTDPWGRALPEWHPDEYVPNKPHVWTVIDGHMVATSAGLGGEDRAYASSTTAYGEWNFKFRMPRNDVSIYVWFIFAAGPQGSYRIGFREDGHQYLLKYTPSGPTQLWKVCTSSGWNTGVMDNLAWHTVKVQRQADGTIRAWKDGNIIHHPSDPDVNSVVDNEITTSERVTIVAINAAVEFDDIVIYGNDITPPAAIANLQAVSSTLNSITLAWTAPGDDGNTGTASQYDVRYSTSPITPTNWDSATPAAGEPAPAAAGSAETFTVPGLSASTEYYFAIKSADEVPNWSELSNVPAGTTKTSVTGRWVFYNRSAFDGEDAAANADDDGAIAPDKTALLPGQTAAFANYTSYSRGINGVMVDIANPGGTPTAADFEFRVGNDNIPAAWTVLPPLHAVTVRAGAGVGGSDRITIIWPDSVIQKWWLQVTVKATTATGLASPDVFYFGNAIGETGNSATDARVTPTDQVDVRNNPHTLSHNPAGIDDAYDFNRDKKVGPTDEIAARNNGTNSTTALQLIAP